MQNESHETPNVAEYRLDEEVIPRSYNLYLVPDLLNATFKGKVLIALDLKQPKSAITLNGAELKVSGCFVADNYDRAKEFFNSIDPKDTVVLDSKRNSESNTPSINFGSAEINEELERITCSFAEPCSNKAYLGLVFDGILNDKLRGFYRSTYIDDSGKEQVLATTHFEATDARRAFPCFDEPQLKATFEISLETNKNLVSISNWPIANIKEINDDTKLVEFEKTMIMSTYLVAFIVGNLEESREVNVDGVPLRVIHVQGKSSMTDFALEIGAHSLRFFSDYFSIPYPGKKLDLIAIPDFAFGAMENLGAVTFRETALLANLENASRADLERVADVVAHEIAHMWFGDLVTMKWWNGIWLNEAFATFMEMLAVDNFRPDWDRWVTFGLSREAAMGVDSLSTTRPIEFEVFHPREAEAMFDVLTYQKGAAVLRMLEQFIGEEVFREGIRDYLNKHKYSNTETSDLWDALDSAVKKAQLPNGMEKTISIRELMDTWIFQGGYPFIAVEQELTDAVDVSQKPFFYENQGKIGSKWIVPLVIRELNDTKTDPNGIHFALENQSASVKLDGNSAAISANGNGYGFYRTSYSPNLFKKLLDNYLSLSTLEKFNLISDSWAVTVKEKDSLDEFLQLAKLMADKEIFDSNMWSIVVSALNSLFKAGDETDIVEIQNTCALLLNPIIEKIGIGAKPDEKDTERSFRALIYQSLGKVGNSDKIQKDAVEKFNLLIAEGQLEDPDLMGAVLEVVAHLNDKKDYQKIYEGYLDPKSPQDEMRYLMALSSFHHSELLENTLKMTLTEIRTQNAPFVIQSMLFDRNVQKATFDFMVSNFDTMVNKYPSPTIPRMLDGLRGLTTLDNDSKPIFLNKVNEFLKTRPIESSNLTVIQAKERLEIGIKFNIRIKSKLKHLHSLVK